MLSYAPNHLIYEYQASQPRLTLFSEIYYNKGWLAYIDGKPAPHFRADYVLRAMVLPPGQHKVEFYFKPKGYYVGNKIDLASSSILILLFIGGLVLEVTKKKNENI